ncbi:kinase-like domain-containing protein [Aspergillus karnatakaensis]|uniref:kinase-like domain-containing protein n=1 Tax=Aspergillus karnatakaensis TaxID=1810916 RepID=UPI003CCDF20F
MAGTIHSLWLDSLQRGKAEISPFINLATERDIPPTYKVDSSVRIGLERLCDRTGKADPPRLLSRLRYDSIDDFAVAIDLPPGLRPPLNLAWLISLAICATIQSGLQDGVSPSDVVDWLNKLDRAVPDIDNHIPVDAPRVHDLLRDILGEYISCLAHINHTILTEPCSDVTHEIQRRIRQAKAAFKKSKGLLDWELNQSYIPERHHDRSPSSNILGGWMPDRHEILGRGTFGDVYKVIERSSGEVYALKEIPLGNTQEERVKVEEKVRNECKNMRRLSYPHIINIAFFYQGADCWNLVMNVVADTNLRRFLSYCCNGEFQDPRSLDAMLPWFGCLVDALAFAHR